MRHAGRERAERSEPVAAAPLFLERLLLPEILEERDRSLERAVERFERKEPQSDRKHIPGARDDFHFTRPLGSGAGSGRDMRLTARGAQNSRDVLPLHLLGGISQERGSRGIDREQAAELIVYAARMIYPGPPVQA